MFQLSEAAPPMSANRAEVGGDIRGDELELRVIGHVEELKVDPLSPACPQLLEPIDRFSGGPGDPYVAQLLRIAADGLRPLHELLLRFADAYDERRGIGEFVRIALGILTRSADPVEDGFDVVEGAERNVEFGGEPRRECGGALGAVAADDHRNVVGRFGEGGGVAELVVLPVVVELLTGRGGAESR